MSTCQLAASITFFYAPSRHIAVGLSVSLLFIRLSVCPSDIQFLEFFSITLWDIFLIFGIWVYLQELQIKIEFSSGPLIFGKVMGLGLRYFLYNNSFPDLKLNFCRYLPDFWCVRLFTWLTDKAWIFFVHWFLMKLLIMNLEKIFCKRNFMRGTN